MSIKLKENWAIIIDPEFCFLINESFKEKTWWLLHPIHSFVISRFDGITTNYDIAKKICFQFCISLSKAWSIIRGIISRYSQCFEIVRNRTSCPPKIYKLKYSYFDVNDSPIMLNSNCFRNCAPIRITWVTTNNCDKKCRYCYMDAKYSNHKIIDSFSKEDFLALVDDAKALSVVEFMLTGGEPLLVNDIYFAINYLIENKISVRMTTKNILTVSELTDTAKKRLIVEQSLDSTDSNTVKYLTGSKDAYFQAIENIKIMSENKMRFSINMVITRKNIYDILNMIKYAQDVGAESIQIAEYTVSMGRSPRELILDKELSFFLNDSILKAKKKTNIPIIVEEKSDSIYNNNGFFCGEGITTLSMVSDGSVTKCPAMPWDNEIMAGNVLKNGLYFSWNYDQDYISKVFPKKSKYMGTVCYDCEKFDKCFLSGRCVLASKRENKIYYGPDRKCEYNNKNMFRI